MQGIISVMKFFFAFFFWCSYLPMYDYEEW